ncbi:MAG: hypothetical protein LBR65_10340 [Culturomica sp.]|nr:hypothetical protein [Culturomica sp.]
MRRVVVFVFLSLVQVSYGRAQAFVAGEGADFEWRVMGRALFDGGLFFGDKTDLGNGMTFADGRIGVVARFLQEWDGKIEFGYSAGRMSIRDVFVGYSRGNSRLQAGHFFEPFGIEGRVGTADYRLMNGASTAMLFGDKRKLGVAYLYTARSYTAVAGFFGDTDTDNSRAEDEGYAVAGKLTYRPLFGDDRLIHLGLSGRFSEHGKSERALYAYKGGVPTNVLSSTANQFLYAAVPDLVNQWKWGADLIWLWNGLYLQGEYNRVSVNRASSLKNYAAQGAYVQAGILLLGDRRYPYSSAQGWVSNPGAGNLELLLRYNVTDLNDDAAEIRGGKLQDVTLGANYFINRYVAVRLNYVHASVDENGFYGAEESFDYVQARLQLNF